MPLVYLILDVHYQTDLTTQTETAKVSGIRFQGIETNEILSEHIVIVNEVAPYESGQFYKREMPCLLALINKIDQTNERFDVIIIDGYVFLDGKEQAGLGKYLYDSLSIKKPVIGIAKNQFKDISDTYAVWRGISKNPLYVTSVGFDTAVAKHIVSNLEGKHRLPNVVKQVDVLGRQ